MMERKPVKGEAWSNNKDQDITVDYYDERTGYVCYHYNNQDGVLYIASPDEAKAWKASPLALPSPQYALAYFQSDGSVTYTEPYRCDTDDKAVEEASIQKQQAPMFAGLVKYVPQWVDFPDKGAGDAVPAEVPPSS